MNLNGSWEFEQTETAYPPEKFTRTIQVPGLIDLAEPEIEQHEKYFSGTQEPRYSWYRLKFRISPDKKGKFAVLNILKSRFGTQVILNDHDLGTYIQCNTPIECNLTDFISYDKENELLIRISERAWLSKQSATGVDREKYTDIPGIWDDVFITFTGPVRIERALVLPDFRSSKVTAKVMIENHENIINRSMYLIDIDGKISVYIREKKSGKKVSDEVSKDFSLRCQNRMPLEFEIDLKDSHPWSPEDPFLYEAVITADAEYTTKWFGGVKKAITSDNASSDMLPVPFGMRDFKAVGRFFHLNGGQYRLLGSNINLFRFFEDPDRNALPWDKEWVKKMFIDIPKSLRWNAFRMCIGIAPKFWYDLADEYGIMLQNEWPMWQVRGWNEQMEKEYTDWIWNDGSHPCIVIWDAMNEASHQYIGNVIIPKLRELDPTRLWDAAYQSRESNKAFITEMEEPHYYPFHTGWWWTDEGLQAERDSYRFGGLFRKHKVLGQTKYKGVPMIMNEYNWLWLNRDGVPGIRTKGYFGPKDTPPKKKDYEYYNAQGKQEHLDRDNYDYLLGSDNNTKNRRDLQAYMMEMQTEAIRSSRNLAGVFSFVYLTNNRGYTGDWFIDDIKDLKPAPALISQYQCFAPFAVFLYVEDGRYQKNPVSYSPGEIQCINLFAVNDTPDKKEGTVSLKIIDKNNKVVFEKTASVKTDEFWETLIPMTVTFPDKPGGYIIVSELTDKDKSVPVQRSRRFIRVGKMDKYVYPELKLIMPPGYPK